MFAQILENVHFKNVHSFETNVCDILKMYVYFQNVNSFQSYVCNIF